MPKATYLNNMALDSPGAFRPPDGYEIEAFGNMAYKSPEAFSPAPPRAQAPPVALQQPIVMNIQIQIPYPMPSPPKNWWKAIPGVRTVVYWAISWLISS